MRLITRAGIFAGIIVLSLPVYADTVIKTWNQTEEADESMRWNRFAEQLYILHKKRLSEKAIRIEERISGYFRQPNFYKEQVFYDKQSGRLLSLIQWEIQHPERIHMIQVYIYDKSGKPIRDYVASYRTRDHDDPMTTEINLHGYTDGLHAFRQFDASNEVIYEKCTGKWKGKPLEIRLDLLDLAEYDGEPDTIMTSPQYAVCFKGIPRSAARYITPR